MHFGKSTHVPETVSQNLGVYALLQSPSPAARPPPLAPAPRSLSISRGPQQVRKPRSRCRLQGPSRGRPLPAAAPERAGGEGASAPAARQPPPAGTRPPRPRPRPRAGDVSSGGARAGAEVSKQQFPRACCDTCDTLLFARPSSHTSFHGKNGFLFLCSGLPFLLCPRLASGREAPCRNPSPPPQADLQGRFFTLRVAKSGSTGAGGGCRTRRCLGHGPIKPGCLGRGSREGSCGGAELCQDHGSISFWPCCFLLRRVAWPSEDLSFEAGLLPLSSAVNLGRRFLIPLPLHVRVYMQNEDTMSLNHPQLYEPCSRSSHASFQGFQLTPPPHPCLTPLTSHSSPSDWEVSFKPSGLKKNRNVSDPSTFTVKILPRVPPKMPK